MTMTPTALSRFIAAINEADDAVGNSFVVCDNSSANLI
jgi:hypothetical protein